VSMGIQELIKYLKGYLILRIEGLNLEKFINISIANGINFWDMKRLSMTAIELNVDLAGYRALKEMLRKTNSRAYVISKKGLPFLFSKLKRRSMLVIGFVIFILLIFVLSSFIWSINIKGANNVSSKEIRQSLSEFGIKPGTFKLNIPVIDIENNMLIKVKEISWIKITLKGTRATVEVKERVDPPKILPEDIPCNIVARRDGIIYKIVSMKGDEVVKEGEPVRKGQILVSGVIERPETEIRYVHSLADIEAKTWYEEKVVIPIKTMKRVRTGKKESKIYINLNDKTLLIKNTDVHYKIYDKIKRSLKLIETDKFELPIEIVIEDYFEINEVESLLDNEEAKSLALEEIEKQILSNMAYDARIINKRIDYVVKEDCVIASALYETMEDIGVPQEIN